MEKIPRHFLMPGAIFADSVEHEVMTVLGSCVAICLWDMVTGTGGINHYMLPLWNGEGLPTPKYGNIAVEQLLRRMNELGCRKKNLVAKVFGGSNIMNLGKSVYAIGERNVLLSYELMEEHGIPVIACETGGNTGRRLVFNTRNGVVFLRKGQ